MNTPLTVELVGVVSIFVLQCPHLLFLIYGELPADSSQLQHRIGPTPYSSSRYSFIETVYRLHFRHASSRVPAYPAFRCMRTQSNCRFVVPELLHRVVLASLLDVVAVNRS